MTDFFYDIVRIETQSIFFHTIRSKTTTAEAQTQGRDVSKAAFVL